MQPNQPNSSSPLNLTAIKASPPPQAALRKAKEEDEWFASDRRKREHQREQGARTIIHWAIQGNIIVAGIIIAICLGVRGFHLIAAEEYKWLQKEQIDLLDNLAKYAGSGAVGSLLTRYLTKNVEHGQGNS
ncbi:hypothetical protein [Rufibacter tibetensis]|uniref:Uncharacterized protein n=1 Tax=Rufibacter tibetensis TaxID=512763 RepID=A0A0P0CRJ0_9BACT|nr:hypothetical protein [Rufibacter tibetensis]ALJ00039.1 hypothetical protein DC20_14960 [Rufibacter tibetensis]